MPIGNLLILEHRGLEYEKIGSMGYEAKKTEHSGAKHGNGAYWGRKWEAKKESSRTRRKNWRREIREEQSQR